MGKIRRRANLSLEDKIQILMRIKLGFKDRTIAEEFKCSRVRITQLRLYESEKIEAEFTRKKAAKSILTMIDSLLVEDEENEENSG